MTTPEYVHRTTSDDPDEMPDGWMGPICALDVPTSDGRMAATPPGGVKTRAYPLTLTRNHVGDPTGYPTIGSVDHVWTDPDTNMLMGEGKLDLGGDDGQNYARQLKNGLTNRMSIDPVEVQAEMRVFDADGNQYAEPEGGWTPDTFEALPEGAQLVTTFADWTLAGLAAVPIPAYSQAAVNPVYGYQASAALPTDAIVAAVVAAPGHGMSAADAEFAGRMVRHGHKTAAIASNYLASPSASSPKARALAENVHKNAADMISQAQACMASSRYGNLPPGAVVAAVGGQVFTKAHFTAKATGPTKMTVTEDGHVYGHVRLKGTCYQYGNGNGDGGFCLQPPPSACAYGKFMVHGAKMDDGSTLSVGALTFGDGHESRGSLLASRRHYDDVSTMAAKVVAEDDEWGVWVTGEVLSEYADRAYDLLLSPLSGHWEPDADNDHYLEMLAAHIVVTPGYAVRPVVASFDDAGVLSSLVLTNDPTAPEPTVAEIGEFNLRGAVLKAQRDLARAEKLADQMGLADHKVARALAREERIARLNNVFASSAIADPGTPWDGSGAASRALNAATANGKINVGEASKSFLAHVGDGSKRGDWKLPYRDGGRIIPRGVAAASGRVGQTQGIDQAAAKSKIAGLYSQIHAKYPAWPASPDA